MATDKKKKLRISMMAINDDGINQFPRSRRKALRAITQGNHLAAHVIRDGDIIHLHCRGGTFDAVKKLTKALSYHDSFTVHEGSIGDQYPCLLIMGQTLSQLKKVLRQQFVLARV